MIVVETGRALMITFVTTATRKKIAITAGIANGISAADKAATLGPVVEVQRLNAAVTLRKE